MRVTVLLFAGLRDAAGAAELERRAEPGSTIASVWQALVADRPALGDYSRVVTCARNVDYARMDTPLEDGDEVAFLPPVSGG